MLLVLCPLNDPHALWFAGRARADGRPCTVLPTEKLSFPRRRSHRLGGSGGSAARTVIELTDGTVVDGARITGVLNRMVMPPADAWQHAVEGERAYATAELHAFSLSWLSALRCPVRNRPTPQCLAGPAPDTLRSWAAAQASGLSCAPVRVGTTDPWHPAQSVLAAARRASGPSARPVHAVCLDGKVLAPGVPARVAAGVAALCAAIGADRSLIGVDFLVDGEDWRFAGTSPLPDLRAGGHRLYRLLLSALGQR
ncbi:hypothetical protein [Streptomyces nondiastaticus]|uniref:ATP-grasp domain-containing protein n=1 Tax=Streptomyces nondiastaticus TaxID=3154512 RepID=A0ABW6TWF0_9ACTN